MNELFGFARSVPTNWTDLLDIVIVSIAIYESLKLIRGTRAVQMGIGSALVVLLFYASLWLQLETVNWVVRNVVGYVVFAAIVLFQTDIRRALAHFGRTTLVRYFSKLEIADENVDEIVEAATLLATQRTGAIIVVERAIGLRNYIESGIPLDAAISYDLLVTVFRPGSPLHDGAVVIQQDRVAAAACFLPLTVNPRVSKDLGTRHRAAIGLSEETDAMALVVSEETGRLSLAIDGQIEQDLEPEQLRYRLEALMLRRTGRQPREEAKPLGA